MQDLQRPADIDANKKIIYIDTEEHEEFCIFLINNY